MNTFSKKELIIYFTTDNKSGFKTKESYVNKKFVGLVDKINNYNKFFNIEMSFTQKLYNYLYKIKEIPKCENCGKSISWRGIFTEGYLKNCSKDCKNKSRLRICRTKATNLEKYGVEHVLNYEEFKLKRKKTVDKKIVNKFSLAGYEIIECCGNDLKIKHSDGHTFIGNRKILVNRLNSGFEVSTILLPIKSIHSTYELEIQNYLKSINISHVIGDKTILNGKEIDIYIPEYKLGIEFDGLYWHSNLYVDNNYHLNKTKLCEDKNIQLLHVFEDEWIFKKNIVISIINSNLNINKEILAKDCDVVEIDDNKSKEFFNNNHIQGDVDSKINIGLIYDGNLVSSMAFNENNCYDYELLRFCNKNNITIINGAFKLIQYFIKKYKPKIISTCVDRRYSNGNLYYELGFKFIENIKPNYWSVKKNEILRETRFNYRENISKNDLTLKRELIYIYDCGSKNLKMTIN